MGLGEAFAGEGELKCLGALKGGCSSWLNGSVHFINLFHSFFQQDNVW